MKRIIVFCFAIMIAFAASAQKNVTKFLGIPVDGSKTAMIQKLKAKGFTYKASSDHLEGEFNGHNVQLSVVTNNNKVYRIMVIENIGMSESDAKIRFNTLCNQFKNNGKYVPSDFVGDFGIASDVDLSYELNVDNKRFEASYYQASESELDTTGLFDWASQQILETYTEEQLQNMDEEQIRILEIALVFKYLEMKCGHKSVWFMLDSNYGVYRILLYYDNELNRANGEDL